MTELEIIVIANLEITDADEYRKYEKGFFPILKKHNGSFITFDDAPKHMEGNSPLKGRVIYLDLPMRRMHLIGSMTLNTKNYQNLDETEPAHTP